MTKKKIIQFPIVLFLIILSIIFITPNCYNIHHPLQTTDEIHFFQNLEQENYNLGQQYYTLGTNNCKISATSYWYLESSKGTYFDPKEKQIYEVFLDSQIDLNEKFIDKSGKEYSYYTGDDIAFMAYLLAQECKKRYGSKKYKEVVKALSKFHIIVVADYIQHALLWKKDIEEDKQIRARMLRAPFACFKIPEGVSFSASFRPYTFTTKTSRSPIHEMIHMVSYIVYNDSGSDHANKDLWASLGVLLGIEEDDSLQYTVMKEYQERYGYILQ